MTQMTKEAPRLDGETPMGEILASYPSAKRALFAHYHIGGCSSCAYRDEETLAEVCRRNDEIPVEEAVARILEAQEHDARLLVEPAALAASLAAEAGDRPRLLDLRTREEHEAVALPGSELYGQEVLQSIFGTEPKDRAIVVYDHTGDRALDAAAYLVGHGFAEAKALRGGIDAYSQEADASVPRYRLEFE